MAGFECLEDIILGARGVRRRRGTRRRRREKEIEACAGGGEGGREEGEAGIISRESAPPLWNVSNRSADIPI